ncbi:MAG: hypothetical protein KBB91_01490 [Candidatus Pacebacteria bacterium]|nr:hypothetical protein [Candidatus Paceibacterota bacterium]MBP9700913.1 hypothetical protein [Candidatus Paceibacterota bacterium]
MTITTNKLIQSFIIVPLVATTLSMNTFTASINEAVSKVVSTETAMSPEEIILQKDREEKAAKIDAYYAKYGLPLAGYGMQMVLVAEKHDLEWNLLPAIAMRETTGGKFACKKNPFGFGSCKIGYESFQQSIDAVAGHIGGANPRTAKYYAGKDINGILKAYNSVIPTYTKEIFSIMDKIEKMEA